MMGGRSKERLLDNLWDHEKAGRMNEAELLLYRSNILGSDKRVTNFGGGNTSAKIMETDPLTGEDTEVLWVKGSGGDIGSMEISGFSTLYMEKLQSLKQLYRGVEFEDEMVGYLPHCTFRLNPRAASIDTPLHAYVPHKHVDHVHADAIIAIAASKTSKDLTKEIFGDKIGWLPWKRPGYELGLWLEKFCLENRTPTASCLKATVCSLGRTPQRVLRYHIINDKHGHRLARFQIARQTRLWWRKHRSLSPSDRKDVAAI